MKRVIALTLVAGSLAACAQPIPPTFTAADVVTINSTYNTASGLPSTSVASMPTVGTGTFIGNIGGDFGAGSDGTGGFVGDLSLGVNFASGAITGTATNLNFVDDLDIPTQTAGGTLDVSGNILVGNTMTATATGTLTGVANIPGTSFSTTGSSNVNLALGGGFRTDTAPADTVTGLVTGTGQGDVYFTVINGYFYGKR